MLHEATARPYLIRAIYDWCVSQGLTPYIVFYVDATVTVPSMYVKDNQIVLNISPSATGHLTIDDDFIEFNARFSGQPHRIVAPINHVLAIFARETQQGFQFPVNPDDFDVALSAEKHKIESFTEENEKKSQQPLTKPHLHRVK